MTEETRRIADLILASAQKAQTGHLAVDSHDSDNKNKTSNPLFHNHNNKKQMYAERQALAKAITLLESQSPKLQAQANALLLYLQRETAAATTTIPSIRIGLAGAPGAGKSTLVEALGKYLLSLPIPSSSSNNNNNQQDHPPSSSSSTPAAFRIIPHRLGVVCVDPSSVVHGGSILGDKTRMPTLSAAHERVYVRPAPSTAGTLGGLAGERTHDTLALLTDYAGYNVCLLETVGLGQSEVEIAQCVDVTVLCIPPGGGDSLQGVKKGILEVADVLCVTKADGNLLAAAQSTAADYKGALQITDNMGGTLRRRVVLTSSETGQGLDQLWQAIESFVQERWESGAFDRKRTEQKDYWMWKSFNTLVQNYVQAKFQPQSSSSGAFAKDGDTPLPPRVAAARLLKKLVDANNGNL